MALAQTSYVRRRIAIFALICLFFFHLEGVYFFVLVNDQRGSHQASSTYLHKWPNLRDSAPMALHYEIDVLEFLLISIAHRKYWFELYLYGVYKLNKSTDVDCRPITRC